MKTGICRLCQQSNVKLHKSHILSKFAYRRMRDETPGANPAPMQVTKDGAQQTTKQIVVELLCTQCEQVISKAESYVAGICYQKNGGCPLYDLLRVKHPVTESIQTLNCSTLKSSLLYDFAIGIFWRFAVAGLPDCETYAPEATVVEAMRLHLLGKSRLNNVVMMLTVIDQPRRGALIDLSSAFSVPNVSPNSKFNMHHFLFQGLFFRMLEGQEVPQEFRAVSLASTPPILAFAAPKEMKVVQRIIELIQSHA